MNINGLFIYEVIYLGSLTTHKRNSKWIQDLEAYNKISGRKH